MNTAVKEGKYIYCIIQASEPKAFGPLGIGGRGDEVYSICFKDISAVVSNSPIVKYSVSRENMIPHEKAIEEVMKKYTVLPVRFATIAEDENEVKKILEREYAKFKDLLKKFNKKKELGLKAIFTEELIYKEILGKYEKIKKMKEMIINKPPEKTYNQRMEIGRMVEEALENEKKVCKEAILDILRPLAEDTKINSLYGERMIINAAFLINEDKETKFDREVLKLDSQYGDKIKFKYVGTLPPFNFINLVINLGKQHVPN